MNQLSTRLTLFALLISFASLSEARLSRIEIEGRNVVVDADALTLKASKSMPIENLMRAVEKEEALFRVIRVTENVYVVSMLDGLPRTRQVLIPGSVTDPEAALAPERSYEFPPSGPRDREILELFDTR